MEACPSAKDIAQFFPRSRVSLLGLPQSSLATLYNPFHGFRVARSRPIEFS